MVPMAPTAAASVGTATPIIILPKTTIISIKGGKRAVPVILSFPLKLKL